jgi:hypothetical protein
VAGANLLRVLRATEAVNNRLRDTPSASAAR